MKVTRQCAQEVRKDSFSSCYWYCFFFFQLEDTLKDLKQSLASHSVSQTPNPPPDLLSESALKLGKTMGKTIINIIIIIIQSFFKPFAVESANLLDNQNKNFIQLLDGQLETRKLIADLVLRFERVHVCKMYDQTVNTCNYNFYYC